MADAFTHPELGAIAFVYGDEKMGLRHIEAKRGIQWVNRIPAILREGKVEHDPKVPRAFVVQNADPSNVAVIRLDWDGQQKTWLVTAHPDDDGKWVGDGKTSRTAVANGPVQGNPSRPNPQPESTTPTPAYRIEDNSANNGGFNGERGNILESTATNSTQISSKSVGGQRTQRDSIQQGSDDADAMGMREAVRAVIGDIPVTFLRGVEGLPTRLRNGLERKLAQRGGKGRTAGLFDPKTRRAYVFTDVVKSAEDAAFVAAHEVAGHKGLRALAGDKLAYLLKRAAQNPTVRKVAAEIAKQRKMSATQWTLSVEEALSELSAAARTGDWSKIATRYKVDVSKTLQSSVRAALENFLRKLKELIGLHVNQRFSDAQLRQLLEASFKAAQREAASATVRNADGVLEQVALDDEGDGFESVSADTRQAYEGRIDALFDGASANRQGVRMLDEGDVLTITGYGDMPVVLNEKHAVVDGGYNHPLTREQWKQMPDWIDNPAAAFERVKDGHITMIGPEKVNGHAVVIGLEPQAASGGRYGDVRHLVLTAFEKDGGTLPLRTMVERGDMKPLYIDQKKASSFYADSGVQFPGSGAELRGSNKTLKTERDLVKYRAERDDFDGLESVADDSDGSAPFELTPPAPNLTPVERVFARRGALFGKLAADGMPLGPVTQAPNGRLQSARVWGDGVRRNRQQWCGIVYDVQTPSLGTIAATHLEVPCRAIPLMSQALCWLSARWHWRSGTRMRGGRWPCLPGWRCWGRWTCCSVKARCVAISRSWRISAMGWRPSARRYGSTSSSPIPSGCRFLASNAR